MPGILLEPFGSKRLFTRFDALAIEFQRLLSGLVLVFGEENIGIGAEWGNCERLLRKRNASAGLA
jgi:hypothetical protein